MPEAITPDMLLNAYCHGYFPMADGREGELGWYRPDPRAIQPFNEGDPLGLFRVRRSLAKRIRNGGLDVTTNRCFSEVIRQCAAPRGDDGGCWISAQIEQLYTAVHTLGYGHSIEAWRGDTLVGGLYGIAIGGAFFAESKFSREPYASQVCYAWLVEHLRRQGFCLLDVQFVNPHLEQFGVVEVACDDYLLMLEEAIAQPVRWQ